MLRVRWQRRSIRQLLCSGYAHDGTSRQQGISRAGRVQRVLNYIMARCRREAPRVHLLNTRSAARSAPDMPSAVRLIVVASRAAQGGRAVANAAGASHAETGGNFGVE